MRTRVAVRLVRMRASEFGRQLSTILRRRSIAVAAVLIVIGGVAVSTSQSLSGEQKATAATDGIVAHVGTPFPGGLFLEPDTAAEQNADELAARGDTYRASMIGEIASQPTAVWVGDWWTGDRLESVLSGLLAAAQSQGRTLVIVTYAIPDRDCGGHSAGGLDEEHYLDWNRTVAKTLAGSGSVVIVEPDSIAMLATPACDSATAERRLPMLSSAVDQLVTAGLTVYLDAGNSSWIAPKTMAGLLERAGIAKTRGFATNVSNFNPVAQEQKFAASLSALTRGSHYVIDVSRMSPTERSAWCNPAGAALGPDPQVADGSSKLDALLWVKHPGSSDGDCNGGPSAGTWWQDYALDLVRNRSAV